MPKSIRRVQNRAVLGRGVVLHASAAVVNGKGVLFLAPSGGGKSTVAYVLEEFSMEIVGDDSTVVSRGTDGVWRIIPCAVFTWFTGKRPSAFKLDHLMILEKGEPALLKALDPLYAAYRILREESIMAHVEMEPGERSMLRETVRELCGVFPVHVLRWSEPVSLRNRLSEAVE